MKAKDFQQNTYDQIADRYAQSYTPENKGPFHMNLDLIIPQVLQMVGDTEGLTVLDAGCGEGIVSRLLAERSASVTGIDISPRFIEFARERDLTKRIRYEIHDLSQALPQYEGAFDLIVSNMVLNDVPDYSGFITTLAQLLKARGRLVLSMNNPYSAVLREKVESYFDSDKAVLYNMAKDGIVVYYFHRTMEEYMAAFQSAGLLLRRLVDLQMPEDCVAKLPEQNRSFPWYSMYHRFPFMVILELVKLEP
jgi:2-polyprenyl-3-methyl-5-hydroxy-6-metoxy-1,4-benzoquinol methylase